MSAQKRHNAAYITSTQRLQPPTDTAQCAITHASIRRRHISEVHGHHMHTVVHKEAALQRVVLHVAAEVNKRHRTRRKLRARRRHTSIHIRHVSNLNTDRAIAVARQRLAEQRAYEARLALSLEPHHVHAQSQVGAELQRRHSHHVHYRVQRSQIA
jgi:hypothetical protein